MSRLALLLLALGACAVGAPPGFSDGNSWTIPLIGPYEDGLLLVPALVNTKGPYLFAIDPDAHVSIVDEDVVADTKARIGEGPRLLDESDTQRNKFYAEILAWELGSLTVKQKPAQIVPKGTFDQMGRRIHGVIGRDIIADSIVFSFDREHGVVTLSTQKAFSAPAGATAIGFSRLTSQVRNVETVPVTRKLLTAAINGVPFTLHLDLGMVASQLRQRSFAKAKLVESELQGAVIDEVGYVRKVTKQGVAATVSAGSAQATHVPFVPYGDRRWPEQDLEGTLGLDFFHAYTVSTNWDKNTLHLTPRGRVPLATRVGRWQSKTLASCAIPGCAKVSLIDPLAGKPPEEIPPQHPGVVVSVVRDGNTLPMQLEVLVAVTPVAGKPPLRWIVANLPPDVDRAMTHLPADYLGATLSVVDVSPFPRECPTEGSCIDLLAPPMYNVAP